MDWEVKFKKGRYYFSWDDRKAKVNIAKHGINFRLALEVFFDENAVVEPDMTTAEERYRIIGRTMQAFFPILFVVYISIEDDGDEIIRLISARKATQTEVKRYDHN